MAMRDYQHSWSSLFTIKVKTSNRCKEGRKEGRMSKAKAKTKAKAEAAVDTDEAKLEFRYRTLLQHHLHLQKEVVSNKKKLQAAKHKRDILSAEIRFLKRRQRHLLKINSAQTEPEPQQVHPKKLSRKRNNEAVSQVVQESGEEETVWEPTTRVEKKPKKWLINDKPVGKRKNSTTG